ncbi:2-deoxy-D-gluconate 3-dehydrogenase [Natranaerovirga hydrolytica]|uniref:2-dehydro-3-deoxy-D-gluconate 5-dehydrogenase n=1 Tax=Natranaerovirga hydrolytica TaxID=680378 RepID=A0A4R1M6T1_9FIRM|nr:2-dehydro-3-deoxy-D-gluconate 5-dehydrogenase KduD [Natranaerovirga hydrolytica]TCK87978.1 2-deoxy-D-gluconate 3-dehydrogenase [Natranaerovirga hydrolytica]
MMLDKFKLDGKVAIVTGAAQGLGQGMAIGLAEAGADIVNVGIGDDSETKAKIEGLGRKYLGINANLMSIEPVNGIIDEVVEKFGKIDILLNNAGTIRREDVLDFSEKDWDDVMNLNLKTVFFLSQAVGKQFVKQGTGGKIINIASMLSFQGGIRVPSYTASKSGIKGITMLLANELASKNINVNAIAPGYMATANTAPIRADEARNKAIVDRIPAGEWGTPEDLAGTAVFLASEASKYINGYTIAVDGGWLAR